jgi:transglutaminase/protease-like cytokinesis protein 3
MKHYFLTPFLLFCLHIFGQNNTQINVDSMTAQINADRIFEPELLAKTLTAKLDSDSLKVRAIYYWITEKIAYDCAGYRNGIYVDYKWDDIDDYYRQRVHRTLAQKKGICEDYARTFKAMCDAVRIPCEVIEGFGLNSYPSRILSILSAEAPNHAWNAVRINNKWYPLDVCWASGSANAFVTEFIRMRNDNYYLTDPEKFILDHHPLEQKWQLLKTPLTKKKRPWTLKAFIKNSRKGRGL